MNQKQLLRLSGGKNFAPDITTLGTPAESSSYSYSVTLTGQGVNQAAIAIASPKTDALEPVQGRVVLFINSAGERDTATLICRTDNIAALPPTTTVCPE